MAGLLASALGAVVCCAFSPFVALLAGGAAGFFAARAEEAPTQRERIGDARAVEPLGVAFEDKAKIVRRAAADALEALGWKPEDTDEASR